MEYLIEDFLKLIKMILNLKDEEFKELVDANDDLTISGSKL